MGDNDLQITIQAVDKANAVLSSVKTQLNSLNGVAANAGKQAGASLSAGMTPGVQAATQVLRQVSPTLASIASAAGPAAMGIAVVAAEVKLLKEAWAMAADAAQFDEVFRANAEISGSFERQSEMLRAMRVATQGTITNYDLMILQNRALNMGVTANVDEMSKLAGYFTKMGEASGMGAKESVSAGFQALGALQTRGLKTLGISLDETKIWDEYAAKLGTVASKLDDVQKRAALVQEILKQAPTGIESQAASLADTVEALKVSQQNFRTEMGLMLQDILGIAKPLNELFSGAASRLASIRGAKEISAQYEQYAKDMLRQGHIADWVKLTADLNLYNKAVQTGAISTEQMAAQLARTWPEVRTAADVTAYLAQASYDGALGVAQTKNALQEEAAAAAAAAAQTAYAAEQFNRFYYEVNNRGWANIAAAGGYVTSGPNEWAMGMGGSNLRATTPSKWSYSSPKSSSLGSGGIGGGGGGSLSEYESMLQQQAADMRSLVEQILQPTDITPRDMADTAAGRYMDKWDEYARKMKSIAADQGSVWRQMVPVDILNQGEDAIKGWAEQQQKLFYAGRMPGEINWGDFVARAKEEIANKQAREALVQEAMRQLQAAGVSMSGADVQSLMGGTPGASTGVEMAGAFGTGLVANDTAAAVTKAFQEQMAAQQKTWELVGSMCIAWFAAGLKMGVTAETGKDIIAALWPWIAEMMNREAPLP
jgi:hypothetical protein